MNSRDISQLVLAGYTVTIRPNGEVVAYREEMGSDLERIPPDPEEANPLSEQDKERYR
jgi:hypothetical protein